MKKASLFFVALVMSTLCFVKAFGQTPTSSKDTFLLGHDAVLIVSPDTLLYEDSLIRKSLDSLRSAYLNLNKDKDNISTSAQTQIAAISKKWDSLYKEYLAMKHTPIHDTVKITVTDPVAQRKLDSLQREYVIKRRQENKDSFMLAIMYDTLREQATYRREYQRKLFEFKNDSLKIANEASMRNARAERARKERQQKLSARLEIKKTRLAMKGVKQKANLARKMQKRSVKDSILLANSNFKMEVGDTIKFIVHSITNPQTNKYRRGVELATVRGVIEPMGYFKVTSLKDGLRIFGKERPKHQEIAGVPIPFTKTAFQKRLGNIRGLVYRRAAKLDEENGKNIRARDSG